MMHCTITLDELLSGSWSYHVLMSEVDWPEGKGQLLYRTHGTIDCSRETPVMELEAVVTRVMAQIDQDSRERPF